MSVIGNSQHVAGAIELDGDLHKYVVINTHHGLFQQNRLPFGVSSASGIFQSVLESTVECLIDYLDVILVSGPLEGKHLATLE